MELWAQDAVRDALSALGGVGTAMGSNALSITPAPWLSSKAGAALEKSLVAGGGAGTSLPSLGAVVEAAALMALLPESSSAE